MVFWPPAILPWPFLESDMKTKFIANKPHVYPEFKLFTHESFVPFNQNSIFY